MRAGLYLFGHPSRYNAMRPGLTFGAHTVVKDNALNACAIRTSAYIKSGFQLETSVLSSIFTAVLCIPYILYIYRA